MYIIQSPLFDFEAFIASKSNDRLTIVLQALPAEKIIAALERGFRERRYRVKLLKLAKWDRLGLP